MIVININKAKVIAHDKRREARTEEFKPHDEIIMKQIPGFEESRWSCRQYESLSFNLILRQKGIIFFKL